MGASAPSLFLYEKIMPESKYTNMVGNPIDGFRCYGIFNDLQDAVDWQDGCDESCWVVEMEIEDE